MTLIQMVIMAGRFLLIVKIKYQPMSASGIRQTLYPQDIRYEQSAYVRKKSPTLSSGNQHS